jgi:hypothetical protein
VRHINSKFHNNKITNSEGVECKINVRCSLIGAPPAHRRIVLEPQIVKIETFVVGRADINGTREGILLGCWSGVRQGRTISNNGMRADINGTRDGILLGCWSGVRQGRTISNNGMRADINGTRDGILLGCWSGDQQRHENLHARCA